MEVGGGGGKVTKNQIRGKEHPTVDARPTSREPCSLAVGDLSVKSLLGTAQQRQRPRNKTLVAVGQGEGEGEAKASEGVLRCAPSSRARRRTVSLFSVLLEPWKVNRCLRLLSHCGKSSSSSIQTEGRERRCRWRWKGERGKGKGNSAQTERAALIVSS